MALKMTMTAEIGQENPQQNLHVDHTCIHPINQLTSSVTTRIFPDIKGM